MNMKSRANTNLYQKSSAILKSECYSIINTFSSLLKEISDPSLQKKISSAKGKFSTISTSWGTLSDNLTKEIHSLTEKSSKISRSCARIKSKSKKILSSHQKEIEFKENLSQKSQKNVIKIFENMQKHWTKSLKSMKKSYKSQEILKNHIKGNINKIDQEISQELSDVLSFTYVDKQGKTIDKELISHESAFLCISEPAETNMAQNFHSVHSEHPSNYSIEFEKCMEEIELGRAPQENPVNVSIDKSFGGWKSEYESDGDSFAAQVNPNEIKNAIKILKKANLLNSKEDNMLDRLSNLLKSSGNTHKIELLLQLYNLQNKPKFPSAQNSQKPPLIALKGKKPKDEDLAVTPKACFIFPDDIELNKTILSSENPLSARQRDESFDDWVEGQKGPGLDGICEDMAEEVNSSLQEMQEMQGLEDFLDVRLEDLLKIPYFVPDMKTVTGDLAQVKEVQDVLNSAKDPLSSFSVLSPSGVKLKSPVKKQTSKGFDCQSTGISSQSGLRSRITLKTGGSENSQKLFTPGSRGGGEFFKY